MRSLAIRFKTVLATLILLTIGTGVFVWSGLYNIGADDPHTRATYALLGTLRDRSIESRAAELTVPDLSDPAKAIQGAGNYNAMCVSCHLSPGMEETELSKGLYPAPPNLTREPVDTAEAFWVIKHGIKASGMAAWGKSMEDAYIWNMAAFLQVLPTLDDAKYDDMVKRSGGHSHGGSESDHHDHHEDALGAEELEHAHKDSEEAHSHDADEHHDEASAHDEDADTGELHEHPARSDEKTADAAMAMHAHADGIVQSHPVRSNDNADAHKDHKH